MAPEEFAFGAPRRWIRSRGKLRDWYYGLFWGRRKIRDVRNEYRPKRKQKGLDEGDGGGIFSGQWVLRGSAIKVKYRLVNAYKLLLPPEQQPKVPGPVEEREIALPHLSLATPELQFEGNTYLPAPAIKASFHS